MFNSLKPKQPMSHKISENFLIFTSILQGIIGALILTDEKCHESECSGIFRLERKPVRKMFDGLSFTVAPTDI